MKFSIRFCLLATWLALGSARADTYNWTNTSGGDWHEPSNWDLGQVPTIDDAVFITAPGIYTVTVNAETPMDSFVLGGASGTQTVHVTGGALRLNNNNYIGPNGVLKLQGHLGSSYYGATLNVDGAIDWIDGQLSLEGQINISSNGSLTITGDYNHDIYYPVVSAGTTRLKGAATMRVFGFVGYVNFINQTNGLFDIEGNGAITGGYPGLEWFENRGMMRKSGGTGTTPISVPFFNSGTFDIQTGTVDLNYVNPNNIYGATATGTFNTAAGTTLKFNTTYVLDNGAVLSGAGTNLANGGEFTLAGTTVTASNLTLNPLTLYLSNVVFSGRCEWKNGELNQVAGWTITPGGTMRISRGFTNDFRGNITNAGTLILTNNTKLRGQGIFGGGKVLNQPAGLIDLQDDSWLNSYSFPSETLVNQGTIRKSGGNGTSVVTSTTYYNPGVLDVQSGLVQTANVDLTGGRLNFGINSATNYGQLQLGFVGLAGTFSANLNNGYVPADGTLFTNIFNASYAAGFDALQLPSEVDWETNFSGGRFILKAVVNTPPTLAGSSYAGGEFAFEISGPSGRDYTISASTNLVQWEDIYTYTDAETPFDFVDPDAGLFPLRYYRVRFEP